MARKAPSGLGITAVARLLLPPGVLLLLWLASSAVQPGSTQSRSLSFTSSLSHQLQQPAAAAAAAAAAHAPNSSSSSSAATFNSYFPQAQRCPAGWLQAYTALHANAPRHLVSVTAETGLADKLVGTVTQLWHAVLTHRALSVVPHRGNPGLADVCEAPAGSFDWTRPVRDLPQAAVDSLKMAFDGQKPLPAGLDPATYAALFLHNRRTKTLHVYGSSNLSTLVTPDPEVLLVTSNRGRTHALATNPHHRQQFAHFGVHPNDAFMCGFFALCVPTAAVQQYYQRYWDVLSEPGVLRIGIQIRAGDETMWASKQQTQQPSAQKVLQPKSYFFECAERLEAAFAAPGQKVVWFLNSDSQALRQAAREVYGSKLLTDDSLQMVHPECRRQQPGSSAAAACEAETLSWAMRHSLGSLLTFAMTDGQVTTSRSGFGRAGAWLADRRDRMFELSGAKSWDGQCNPAQPMSPAQSALAWSGI